MYLQNYNVKSIQFNNCFDKKIYIKAILSFHSYSLDTFL